MDIHGVTTKQVTVALHQLKLKGLVYSESLDSQDHVLTWYARSVQPGLLLAQYWRGIHEHLSSAGTAEPAYSQDV